MMKIEKVRWDEDVNRVAVTIEGYGNVELCFDMDEIVDKRDFKKKIKARLQEINALEVNPPINKTVIPEKYELLKEVEGEELQPADSADIEDYSAIEGQN